MRRIIGIVAIVGALFAISVPLVSANNGAGGVTGAAFYVDGELYRTVGTPTDLSHTRAPDHSFDVIYDIAEQTNVATAAPGDRDYNGGRWRVHHLEFVDYGAAVLSYDANGSGDFDSDEEIMAAMEGGAISSDTIVMSFTCPVIPLP